MTFQILNRAALIAMILAMMSGGTASASGDDAEAMPLGPATTAPSGFVEMCERTPAECLSVADPTDQMLSEVRDWASRARWAAVFQAAGIATAEPPQAIATGSATPSSHIVQTVKQPKPARPEDIRALKDQSRKRRSSPRPKTASATPSPEIAPPSPPRSVADMSVEALEAVSRRWNRAIRRSSDAEAYGREDVWMRPDGRRAAGDCEDYVLAKRHALIEDGVDPAALSIAIVRTRQGEIHAVLLVSTADGEQVLDNLSPWVLPWREAPYEWLERQAPGQPRVWMRAAAPAG